MSLAMVCLGIAVLMAIVRIAFGPSAFDRVLAVNVIGTLIILGIALHGFIMGRPEFVDISILYAILNFIGTFAILKLFSTGGLGDDTDHASLDKSGPKGRDTNSKGEQD